MSKAKLDTYTIESSVGIFDIVVIKSDKKEHEILSILKNDLIQAGEFSSPKQSDICWASVAAFIMYMDSISEILATHRRPGELDH